mgnify:CR=1 FL=1
MNKNIIKRLSLLALGSIILFIITLLIRNLLSSRLFYQLLFFSIALFISSFLIFIKAWIISRIKMFKEKESKIILWLSIFIISTLTFLAFIMALSVTTSINESGYDSTNQWIERISIIISMCLYWALIAMSIISFIVLISLTVSCFLNRKKNNPQINQ